VSKCHCNVYAALNKNVPFSSLLYKSKLEQLEWVCLQPVPFSLFASYFVSLYAQISCLGAKVSGHWCCFSHCCKYDDSTICVVQTAGIIIISYDRPVSALKNRSREG